MFSNLIILFCFMKDTALEDEPVGNLNLCMPDWTRAETSRGSVDTIDKHGKVKSRSPSLQDMSQKKTGSKFKVHSKKDSFHMPSQNLLLYSVPKIRKCLENLW